MTEGQWTSVTNSRHGLNKSREKFRGQSKTNYNNRGNTKDVNKSSPSQQQNTLSSSRHPNYGPNHNTYSFPPDFDMANSFSHNSDISNSDVSSGTVSPDITLSTFTLPSYHIELTIECPFANCQGQNKPGITITDSTHLVEHLRDKHKIHFSNLHHVYLILGEYLKYWAKQITQEAVMEQLTTDISGDDTIYVIDPEKLPQDKNIREELQREKLDEVLQIQANERNSSSRLQRGCLFCNSMCENRVILFRHMFTEHNFNIGLPDNLANVDQFLQILENKLNGLQCLYCEKTFMTPAVLRKHMRKKKHFKINARNRIYDRFYVINYLEPGKNWETYENERYESDEDHNRDDSWDDWNEEEPQPTICLFCENISRSSKEAQSHMKNIHGFDLLGIKNSMELDFYQTIILINYIRLSTSLNTCMACDAKFDKLQNLTEHMTKENCFIKVPPLDNPLWKDPKYLLPTQSDDPLLGGFEDDNSSAEDDDNEDLPLHFPNNTVIIPEKAPEELEEQIKQMLTLNKSEIGTSGRLTKSDIDKLGKVPKK